MPKEIATYCEGCCRTFEARYDTANHSIHFTCATCIPLRAWSLPSVQLTTCTPEQRRKIRRMLEATAEAEGLPCFLPIWIEEQAEPSLPPVYPVKVTPLEEETLPGTLTAQPLDGTAMLDFCRAINATMESIVRAFVNALSLPSAEPGKPLEPEKLLPRTPSLGEIVKWKTITSLEPHPYFPRPVVPPLPPVTLSPPSHTPFCIPMEPKIAYDLDKIERIKKMTELLRQCQVKKPGL